LRAENQHGRSVEDAELNRKSTEENRGWALAPGAMEISADQNTHPPQKKNRDPTEGEAEAILKSKSRCEENKTDASGRNRGNKYMRKEKRRSDLMKLTKGKTGSIKK
jgi:hypothetical protein